MKGVPASNNCAQSKDPACLYADVAARSGEQSSKHPAQPCKRQHVPAAIDEWAAAWNTFDAKRMADAFTSDGVYADLAFGANFTGRAGVMEWVETTAAAIANVTVSIEHAFASGDDVAVVWTFGGEVNEDGPLPALATGPNARGTFAVQAVSTFVMCGEHIRRAADYYNQADVLRQVGIPADAPLS